VRLIDLETSYILHLLFKYKNKNFNILDISVTFITWLCELYECTNKKFKVVNLYFVKSIFSFHYFRIQRAYSAFCDLILSSCSFSIFHIFSVFQYLSSAFNSLVIFVIN